MPRLFLIRGLPGVGKSKLGYDIQESNYDTVGPYAADDFFVQPNGDYNYNPAFIAYAHTDCQRRVKNAMLGSAKKPDIVVTNTFTRKWEMKNYHDMARDNGYEVIELTIKSNLSDEELSKRNVHGVSKETIAKMRNRWED